MGALKGLKVLDLTRVLAGPWASQMLADLGADVIKVERPHKGDDTRHWGPPYIDNESGFSAYFSCANRNKRNVLIDLKSPQGKDQILALVKDADVLIENYKTDQLNHLGLGYKALADINPGLVYCSITGFGQTGPYKDKPGYDLLIQAMCGLMSVTGDPASGPQKVGVAVTDICTGLYATIAILAALNERHRSTRGQFIDLALFDVGTAIMANQASNYLVGGKSPKPMGNAHPNIVPYQSFVTHDGYCIVAVGNDAQFARFCIVLKKPELSDDPRFKSNSLRVKNREILLPCIQTIMLQKTTKQWIEALEALSVPCAPINDMAAVFADPQIQQRDMCVELSADGSILQCVGNPIKFSRTQVEYKSAPQKLKSVTENVGW